MLFSVLLKPWPASIEAHLNIRELLSTILTATETYFNSVLEEFRKRELRSDDSLTEAYRLFGILVQALTRFSALWCTCPLLIAVALLRWYSYRIATSLPLQQRACLIQALKSCCHCCASCRTCSLSAPFLSPCLTETNNKNNRPTTPPFWACQLQSEATAWRSLATLVISCGIKDHNAFRVLAPALDDSPALASTKLSMLSDCLMSITEGPISSLVETLLRLLEVCHAFSFSTHSNIERATASVVRSLLVSNHSNTQEFVQGMQVLSRFIQGPHYLSRAVAFHAWSTIVTNSADVKSLSLMIQEMVRKLPPSLPPSSLPARPLQLTHSRV